MAQWPQQQPPYDPYNQQQQQQQPAPYQPPQPYNPGVPAAARKPGGGSIIKTLNIFSSKPSYVSGSGAALAQPPVPGAPSQYVSGPQSYAPPATAAWAPPAPAPYQSPPSHYPQPPVAPSYTQPPPAPLSYQPPPPPPPATHPQPQPQPPPVYQYPSPAAPPTTSYPAPTPAAPYQSPPPPPTPTYQPTPPQPQAPSQQSTPAPTHSSSVQPPPSSPPVSSPSGPLVERLQSELDDLRLRAAETDDALLRAKHEAKQLSTQLAARQGQGQGPDPGQLALAQQEAQQLRANAETNHKLAADKERELDGVRRELLDLKATHAAQGQELERARLDLAGLRQQADQNATFQEAYRNMYQELHDLKATLELKDAEIARLNQAIVAAQQQQQQQQAAAFPATPAATPPVWPPNPNNQPLGVNTTSPPPQPFPPTAPPSQPAQHYSSPPPQQQQPGIPSWVEAGSAPTVPPAEVPDDEGEDPEPSASEREWVRQKQQEGASNEAIDVLMANTTGLENVKEHFLRVKSKIDTARRQGVDVRHERFDVVLTGNPGTGKTDVSALYALFLSTYGSILPADGIIKLVGSQLLANDGLAAATKAVEQLQKHGGGIFLLDDAHYLTQHPLGAQVLDSILSDMESYSNYGKLIFVFAGRNKMVDEHPGLAAKIPCVLQFNDYSDREMHLMLRKSIMARYNGRMQVAGGMGGLYMRTLVRRLGRGRGRDGFGNAREVNKAFSRVRDRQGDRLIRERREGLDPDDFYFSREDLIGPDPSQAILRSAAWKKMQELIGLDTVKQSVHSMIDMIATNYKRELQEKPPMEVSLNRVFLGSPGTGKTSVAKLYGQILVDLGLLSSGEVVTKNPSDFVGNVLGETETKTKAILSATVGKVLIIDEAYMLYPSGQNADADIYKTAVIDTLVAEIQSTPGEDRCVLLLGYEQQMETMFQNVNPGLARRFALGSAFRFHDFSDQELRQILELKLWQQGLHATEDAKRVASEVLARARVRPNFGNAGEVENMIGQAKVRYQTRISRIPPPQRPEDIVFEPQDFDLDFARGSTAAINCRKLFEDVVGCEELVDKLEGYQRIAVNAKAAGIELHELIPMNFLFKGPPGTGKTMTARKMGRVYYEMGFLSSDKVVECSATDLIGTHVGQTGPKTQKLFEKALGQVLFVDEAYRLGEGGYGAEALNEMVDILTKPSYVGKMIVILAGYDSDMNQLLAVNPGLSSRFPETIAFKNMTPKDCIEVLVRDLERKKISAPFLREPGSAAYREVAGLVAQLAEGKEWGNARDMRTLAKTMIGVVYNRTDTPPDVLPTLPPQDAVECVRRLLQERRARERPSNPAGADPPLAARRAAAGAYQAFSS